MKLSKETLAAFRKAGRAGGLKGWAKLTPEQRIARGEKAAAARKAKRANGG